MKSGQEFMEEIFMKKNTRIYENYYKKILIKITFIQKKSHIYKPKITNILKVTFFQVELPNPRETSALNSFSLSLHASISLFRLSHFVFVKKSFHPSFLREQFFLSINLSADFIFTNLSIS